MTAWCQSVDFDEGVGGEGEEIYFLKEIDQNDISNERELYAYFNQEYV